MKRKNFLRLSSVFGLFLAGPAVASVAADPEKESADKYRNDREYWLKLMDKMASPILGPMSQGKLRSVFKPAYSPTWDGRNNQVAYMEAFGRLIAGLAPYLNLDDNDTEESVLRKRLRTQVHQSLGHAVDPESPDYLYWGNPQSRQPLVDAAYIAQALLQAPEKLWQPLDEKTKAGLIREFTKIRQIQPFNNNWILFAAIIESFLLSIDQPIDAVRIDSAIDQVEKWYVGDGWYSDGTKFHFDHYNGYVIHPMLVDILRVNVKKGRRAQKELDEAYKRMQRYASFQERYISPQGTYPVFGRSSTYRAGLFQPLVKLALENNLPAGIAPAQVRCALTLVLKNLFVPASFTGDGYLTLGLVGDKQADLADYYSNTGSMYLTSLVFLALGLRPEHEFWAGPYTAWTQVKAWSGAPFARDYAVDY